MSFSENYIVYQAYGSKDILNELIYSIATLYKHTNNSNIKIVVYTDNTEYLRKFLPESVIYEVLTKDLLFKWRGNNDFVHRVKIELLINFCEKYSGKVLYLDTDTVFTESPDLLFKTISDDMLIMHTNEGRISNTKNKLFNKIAHYLNNRHFFVNQQNVTIPVDQTMWNAGVLGFTSTQVNLLYDVLLLTDVFYAQYKKHIVEQLSFSFVFSSNKLITAAENHIFHYWNFKEFRPLLNEYFQIENSFEKIINTLQLIDPSKLILPKIEFEKQSHLVKQFKKHMLKQKWHMPTYATLKP